MIPDKIEATERVRCLAYDIAGKGVVGEIARYAERLAAARVIWPTTASTPAASRSTTATDAPSLAKRNAPARPMPDAAAVTMPILFARRMVSSFELVSLDRQAAAFLLS
jgi:hypothetical protein